MSTAPTQEDRLREADRAVEEVKQSLIEDGFVRAVQELAESDAVDLAFAARLEDIANRLNDLPGKLEPHAFDKEQLYTAFVALNETQSLMQKLERGDDGRLDTLNEALIRVERIRHVIRDALDEHVAGIHDDRSQVVRQLVEWLPSIPRREIARLVGVNERTLYRRMKESGAPERRLQLVAQLVAVLRHSWTPEGVVAWFDRPNRELDDRKPLSIIDNAGTERALLMAARASRSQYGT